MNLSAKLGNWIFVECEFFEFRQIFEDHQIFEVFKFGFFQVQESKLIKAVKFGLIDVLIVDEIISTED